MTSRPILNSIFAMLIIGSAYSQKLTIAFTNIPSLQKGAKVYAVGKEIGYVTDINPNKAIDTLFVSIKINQNIKIPRGSKFYLDVHLIEPSRITIEYSTQKDILTSKDISFGIVRPLKTMRPSQFDSERLNIKRLELSTIDTAKTK